MCNRIIFWRFSRMGFLGLFGDHKKETQNAISYLTDTTMNTIVKVKSDCASNTSLTQDLAINIGSDDVIKACLAIAGNTPESIAACAAFKTKGAVVDGISQDANVVTITSCKMDTNTTAALQQQLTAQIDQKLKQTDDAAGSALKSLFTALNTTGD